jgi:hypothetical protein
MYKDIVGESFKRHTMYKISGHGFGNQIAAIAKAKRDHMDSLVVGDLAISGRDANAAVISFGGSHYINYDLIMTSYTSQTHHIYYLVNIGA